MMHAAVFGSSAEALVTLGELIGRSLSMQLMVRDDGEGNAYLSGATSDAMTVTVVHNVAGPDTDAPVPLPEFAQWPFVVMVDDAQDWERIESLCDDVPGLHLLEHEAYDD